MYNATVAFPAGWGLLEKFWLEWIGQLINALRSRRRSRDRLGCLANHDGPRPTANASGCDRTRSRSGSCFLPHEWRTVPMTMSKAKRKGTPKHVLKPSLLASRGVEHLFDRAPDLTSPAQREKLSPSAIKASISRTIQRVPPAGTSAAMLRGVRGAGKISPRNGLIYPAVRRPPQICMVCFRPALVYNPQRNVRVEVFFTATQMTTHIEPVQ